jgi:hypothetical protein
MRFIFHGSVIGVNCQHFNVSDTTLKKAGCGSVTFWYGSEIGSADLPLTYGSGSGFCSFRQ